MRVWLGVLLAVAGVLSLARFVEAHAVLKETTPAANSTVAGPDVPIQLKFNSRIDAARSKLQLSLPDNSIVPLTITDPASLDTLSSKATGLKPGGYRVLWQVLASDGHITRGELPFTVKGQ